MNLFTRIICLVVLLSCLTLIIFQTSIQSQSSSAQNTVTAEAERITGDKFRHFTRSPKGTKIYSVKVPSGKMVRAIDKGIDDLIAVSKSKKYKFKKRLNHSDYMIFIARADRNKDSSDNYSPDIAVAAQQYSGSIYDKGGYIYAAGMVVAFNPCAFVIAEHTKDFDRVSNVVRYEGEHLVLWHNDRALFNETADHSKGGGHPILK